MPKFLSDEWVTEARRLRAEYEESGAAPPKAPPAKVNLVVTDVPFGEGTVKAFLDSTGEHVELDLGHLDTAEATLTTDYDTARAVLVDGNPQAGMQAFMAGKVKVQGDMAKLMPMMQSGGISADATLAEKIQAITD